MRIPAAVEFLSPAVQGGKSLSYFVSCGKIAALTAYASDRPDLQIPHTSLSPLFCGATLHPYSKVMPAGAMHFTYH
jgi:hypothetical protein